MFKFKTYKPFVPPTATITDKQSIVKYATEYLKTNSLIDLWWFIHNDMNYKDAPDPFVRDTAYQMVGNGHFEFAKCDNDRIFLIIKRHWVFARPLTYAIILLIISAVISLIVGRLTNQDNSQLQFLKDAHQDSLIQKLQQNASSLPKVKMDSKYKNFK